MRLLVPALLFLCLLAGGSVQGMWGMFALELLAIAMLVAIQLRGGGWREIAAAAGPLPVIGFAFLLLVLAELIPLPASIWASLPGRALFAHGFDLLGIARPSAAWSIAPDVSLATLLPLLIPVALLVAVLKERGQRPQPMVGAVVLATLCGVLLGFLQVSSGGAERWYLYRYSAFNQATGFFANSNHMGTLLLVNIPLVVALASEQLRARADLSQRGLVLGVAIGIALVLLIAVLLNHSTALLLLGGPVVLLSLAIPQWRRPDLRKWMAAAAALALVAAVGFGVKQGRLGMTGEDSSVQTRAEIWTTAARALDDFKLTGSGLGTFQRIYRHYEDPNAVDMTFVNHAHNDYLEVAVELGLPGLLLVLLFLGWWTRRAAGAWRSGELYARAGAVGSATILLHSLVDFPLRTAAISALFALCIALMITRRGPAAAAKTDDLWPSRHLVAD